MPVIYVTAFIPLQIQCAVMFEHKTSCVLRKISSCKRSNQLQQSSKLVHIPESFEDWSVQQYPGNILHCSHVYIHSLTNLLPQLLALNLTFFF